MITSLEEYLSALRNTTDERVLKNQLGVYDNYYIYLRTDFDPFIDYLSQRGFTINHNFKGEGHRKEALEVHGFVPIDDYPDYRKVWMKYGQTELSIVNLPECGDDRFQRFPTSKKWLDDLAKEYHTTITIHPDMNPNHTEWGINIAKTTLIIGEFCLENKVPACFPYANGREEELSPERFLHHRP